MGIDEMLAEARANLVRLEPAAAWAAAQQPGTFLVDSRPEFQRRTGGELPGAIVIERNHLEWRLDPSSPGRIPEAVDVGIRWIIVCDAGYSSSLAADSLRRIGLTRSTDVIGGFQAWRTAGLPVETATSPRPPRGPGEAAVIRSDRAGSFAKVRPR
jgi:rhodanese-related sulfurtransferase